MPGLTIKLVSAHEAVLWSSAKGRSDPPMSTEVTNEEEPLESVKKVPAATTPPSRESRGL